MSFYLLFKRNKGHRPSTYLSRTSANIRIFDTLPPTCWVVKENVFINIFQFQSCAAFYDERKCFVWKFVCNKLTNGEIFWLFKGGGIIAVNYEARACGVTRQMRGDAARGQFISKWNFSVQICQTADKICLIISALASKMG